MPSDSVVLVAGAGYLGSFLVRELLRRGRPVRALVHTASEAAAELAQAGADVVAVDAAKPGALVGVCDGCCAVASCMAADMRWSSGTPEQVDRNANIALFQEAAAAAASRRPGATFRFLLVATFEGKEAQREVPLMRAKEAAVEYIQQMAGEYGISYVILRPTAYFRDFTDMPWQKLQASNRMLVPGGGHSRYNPIDGADLAAFMADCLLDPHTPWANREVRIGGPEVLTFRDTIYAAADALGKPREQVQLVSVPVLLLRLLAALCALLSFVWPPAARTAGALWFVVYASTHDSIGIRYGSRTVRDHYAELRQQLLANGRGLPPMSPPGMGRQQRRRQQQRKEE